MSQITKKALEESLKRMLVKKPLSRITIKDITNDCGINRMTFYYHFKDIYDLVEWTCIEDAAKAINGNETYDTWQQGFLQIFHAVLENKSLIINVYHSISHEQVENYLYTLTYNLIKNVVDAQAEGLTVLESDKNFIADFYKYAFVGILLDWIKKDMKENPKEIIDRLSTLINGDILRALKKYAKNRSYQSHNND